MLDTPGVGINQVDLCIQFTDRDSQQIECRINEVPDKPVSDKSDVTVHCKCMKLHSLQLHISYCSRPAIDLSIYKLVKYIKY